MIGNVKRLVWTLRSQWRGLGGKPERVAFVIGLVVFVIPVVCVMLLAYPVGWLLSPVVWLLRPVTRWVVPRLRARASRVGYPGRWRRPWVLVWVAMLPPTVMLGIWPLVNTFETWSAWRFGVSLYLTVVLGRRLFHRRRGVRFSTRRLLRATRRKPWRGYFKTGPMS